MTWLQIVSCAAGGGRGWVPHRDERRPRLAVLRAVEEDASVALCFLSCLESIPVTLYRPCVSGQTLLCQKVFLLVFQ